MDERASGSMVGFIVALGVAGLLLVGLLSQGDDESIPEDNPVSDKVLEEKAVSLSRLLLESGGHTSVAGQDWLDNGDDVQRLGLRNSTSPGIDFNKLHNLRLAKFEADNADGRVNYEEARAGLGLDTQGLDVHIRAKPRLRSLDELLATGDRDAHLRVGYIGNAIGASEAGSGAAIDSLTCDGVNDSIRYTIQATNPGVTTTQFTAILHVEEGSRRFTETLNGVTVDPGQSTTLSALIPALHPSLCSAAASAEVELYDPEVKVASRTFAALVDPTTAPSTAPADLSLDTSHAYFLTTDDVGLAFDSDELKNADTVTLTVVDAASTTVYTDTFALGAPPTRERNIGPLAAGTYDATFSYGSTVTTERVLVSATAIDTFSLTGGGGTWSWHEAVPAEVGQVEQIVSRFCPYDHDDATSSPLASPPVYADRCGHLTAPLQGSIFPDMKRTMNDDLPAYLLDGAGAPTYTHFTILVVGSEVDHNAMTSASAKHAIRDWVYGGGTLVVFGSAEQSVTWLQPIFHAAIQSSSGGIATPDNLHPVLHTPDPLDWDEYVNPDDRVWAFNAGAGDYFTNVVTGPQSDEAVLALSDPGDFQLGNVYLTTWQPFDIYNDGNPDAEAVNEGMKLIHNLFMMGYRDLYLDYGPPIPTDATVMTAQSLRTVDHPQLGEKPLAFTVYVFRSV